MLGGYLFKPGRFYWNKYDGRPSVLESGFLNVVRRFERRVVRLFMLLGVFEGACPSIWF